MRIVERYGMGFKLLRGAGAWSLFDPCKFVLSLIYRLWLQMLRGRPGATSRALRVVPQSGRGAGPCVVSIGNIEAGGGGKTPCTLRLAEEIRTRGGTPVVVSRGYRGRAERFAPCVVPGGRNIGIVGDIPYTTEEEALSRVGSSRKTDASIAAFLGDEIMLYRSRAIPVVIDANRGRGARLAVKLFTATHILLDDAFQNRSIVKDVEIVLLDAERPFGNGRLLPFGPLRERPSAIGRADVVLFTRTHAERVPHEAEQYVGGKHLFFASHEPVELIGHAGETAPLSLLSNRECTLFSGIARPGPFEEMIVELGARPRRAFRFIDHHRYAEKDILLMLRTAGSGALFVTTEKDWVKTHDLFPPDTTLYALRIDMRILRIETLMNIVATASSGCGRRSPETP